MSYELKLKELRRRKGMTQKALADAVGVTVCTVSNWESGTYLPGTVNLQAIAATLNCSLDELMVRKAESPA